MCLVGLGDRRLQRSAGDDGGHRRPVLGVGVDVAVHLLAVRRVGSSRGQRVRPAIGAQQGFLDGRSAVRDVTHAGDADPAWLTAPARSATTAATPTME